MEGDTAGRAGGGQGGRDEGVYRMRRARVSLRRECSRQRHLQWQRSRSRTEV